MKMNVALTGSSGFLGGFITDSLLKSGASVHHISRNPNKQASIFGSGASIIPASLGAREMANEFKNREIHTVIHAATHFCRERTLEELEEVIEANLNFSIRIFEAAKSGTSAFVNLNSLWQKRETTFGQVPYSASKEAFRQYCMVAKNRNMKIKNLYVPETFGPGDNRGKVVARLLDAKKKRETVKLRNTDTRMGLTYGPFLGDYLARFIWNWPENADETAYVNFPEVSLAEISSIIDDLPVNGSTITDVELGLEDTSKHLLTDEMVPIEGILRYSELRLLLSSCYENLAPN